MDSIYTRALTDEILFLAGDLLKCAYTTSYTPLIVFIPAHWLVRFCFWAADLLERAVYALETACHPGFLGGMGGGAEGGGGCSRLDYACDENKVFYHALFRHMQAVGRRGCNRFVQGLAHPKPFKP